MAALCVPAPVVRACTALLLLEDNEGRQEQPALWYHFAYLLILQFAGVDRGLQPIKLPGSLKKGSCCIHAGTKAIPSASAGTGHCPHQALPTQPLLSESLPPVSGCTNDRNLTQTAGLLGSEINLYFSFARSCPNGRAVRTRLPDISFAPNDLQTCRTVWNLDYSGFRLCNYVTALFKLLLFCLCLYCRHFHLCHRQGSFHRPVQCRFLFFFYFFYFFVTFLFCFFFLFFLFLLLLLFFCSFVFVFCFFLCVVFFSFVIPFCPSHAIILSLLDT